MARRARRRSRDGKADQLEVWPGHIDASSVSEQEWERYVRRVHTDPDMVGCLAEETPFGTVLWSETRRPVALVLGSAEDPSPARAQRVAREINQIHMLLDGKSVGGARGYVGAVLGLMASLFVVGPVLEDFAPANNVTAVVGMVSTFALILGGYIAGGFGERIRSRRQHRVFRDGLDPVVGRLHRIGQMMDGHPSEADVRAAVLHTLWAQPDTGVVDAGVDRSLEEIEQRLAEAVEARQERDAAVDQEISHLRDSTGLADAGKQAGGELEGGGWLGRWKAAVARAEQEARQRAEQRAAGARAHLVDQLKFDIAADRSVAGEYRMRSKGA